MNKNATDSAIEIVIMAKSKIAPRITPDDINSAILTEHYFTAQKAVCMTTNDTEVIMSALGPTNPLALLTFCVLVLKNGFTVTGESACASPENFDAEIGRKIARQNAINKVWPLMGYALKQKLHEAGE